MPPMNLDGGISRSDWDSGIRPACMAWLDGADLVVGAAIHSVFPKLLPKAIVAAIPAACRALGAHPPARGDIVHFVATQDGRLRPRCLARLVRLLCEAARRNPALNWRATRRLVLSKLVPPHSDLPAWHSGVQIKLRNAPAPTRGALQGWGSVVPKGLEQLRWLLRGTLRFDDHAMSAILELDRDRLDRARGTLAGMLGEAEFVGDDHDLACSMAAAMLRNADFIARFCQHDRLDRLRQTVDGMSEYFHQANPLCRYDWYCYTFWGPRYVRPVWEAEERLPWSAHGDVGHILEHWVDHNIPPVVPNDRAVRSDLNVLLKAALDQQRCQGEMRDAVCKVFKCGGWRAVPDDVKDGWGDADLAEGDVRASYEAVIKIIIDLSGGAGTAGGTSHDDL